MPVSDLSFDYVNRRISRPSGSDTFSTQAFYSWLIDQLDELSALDDKATVSGQDATLTNAGASVALTSTADQIAS